MDTKKLGRIAGVGHRITGQHSGMVKNRGIGWEVLHVCIDDASRLAYTELLPDEKKESAIAFLDRALAWFDHLGVTVERVMTDNGSAYRSHAFRGRLKEAEIRHIRTRPYTPKTNGKAERFIQTSLREWAYARAYQSSAERGHAMLPWIAEYKRSRHHSALAGKPPLSVCPGPAAAPDDKRRNGDDHRLQPAARRVHPCRSDTAGMDDPGLCARAAVVNRQETSAPAPADPADRVRAFYESRPYPAPITNLDRHREIYRDPDRRRALFHLLWPTEAPRADREILVAGCGTSQAAIHALREPEARVTAIDISETSLRHTRDLQQKYGLRNLDLHRLAIEEVGQLGRMFDQIVCTGVLHHLPDPDIGLHALRGVLMTDGAMHLMVYAAYGRAGIYMMQEYCRLLGVGPSDEELRHLGIAIGALPPDHPIAGVARRAKDFGNPDALADALLHPRDRAYTVPQLYAWLERCGLSFGRWFEQAPYLPQCGAMARMPHAARLALLSPPLQHAAVELLRGTMAKHNLVVYRDDRPAESQPIGFDGDAWRGYVPLRLPWTLCVRDRAPPGSAAVLINRAHTYSDLALPIDLAQDRMFAAIDGHRPIDEILRIAAGPGAAAHARRFFEQLWQYDHIVFDATNAP